MKLTAPIYVLKSKAKALKRSEAISMAEALDQIAKTEGFNSWSLLQSKAKTPTRGTIEEVLNSLNSGDLLLIGARPGIGKTTLTLQLLLQAVQSDRPCFFFSLEYAYKQLTEKLTELDKVFEPEQSLLKLDCSDDISSAYIINKTQDIVTERSLIAIDYLQLLDQQRNKPPLQEQIEALKKFAQDKRCIVIFISQIDRSFVQKEKILPSLEDVRLPNPLDLSLFNKAFFVRNGHIYH